MDVLLLNFDDVSLYESGGKSFLDRLGRVTVLSRKDRASSFQGLPVEVRTVEGHDEDSMVRAASALAAETSFDAVVTTSEHYQLAAAELRERLGIAGDRPADVQPFRDKILMKHRVALSGMRVPEAEPFDDLAIAVALLARHRKVVVKPRAGMGAAGMRVVSDPAELERLFHEQESAPFAEGGYEVEEFIDGALHHVDTVLDDGRLLLGNVGRYFMRHRSSDGFLDLEFAGSAMLGPSDLRQRIIEEVVKALDALGQTTGVAHTEVFLTEDEQIVFCEAGSRPGGAGIPVLMEYMRGVNLTEAHLRLQLGLSCPVAHPERGVAATMFFYGDGRRILSWPDVETGRPEWIVRHRHVPAGTITAGARTTIDGVAHYLVVASDESELEARIAWVHEHGGPRYESVSESRPSVR